MEKETALIEAILYLEGEPIDENNLSKISGLSIDVVKLCLEKLHELYADSSSGIEIVQLMGGWVIMPKKEFWDVLKNRYGKKKRNKTLSCGNGNSFDHSLFSAGNARRN
nr:SMC-Scp complex subunit ScpB [Treponema phagedenis]